MPRRTASSRTAAAHQSRFRDFGIEPFHARYATCSYEGENLSSCSLCGHSPILHNYTLEFAIPRDDDDRDRVHFDNPHIHIQNGDGSRRASYIGGCSYNGAMVSIRNLNGLVHRVVRFKSVGSECIYLWAGALAEMGQTDGLMREASESFEQQVVTVVRNTERQISRDRAIQRRLATINTFFDGGTDSDGAAVPAQEAGVALRNVFTPARRQAWADNFGDVGVHRMLQAVTEVYDHSPRHRQNQSEGFVPSPENQMCPDEMREYFTEQTHSRFFLRRSIRFNIATARPVQNRRWATVCNICARGFPPYLPTESTLLAMRRARPTRVRRRVECEFCGAHEDYITAELDPEHPASHPGFNLLAADDRETLRNISQLYGGLADNTRSMVRDIMQRAIEYRSLTARQSDLLTSIVQENQPAETMPGPTSDRGTPICPVHSHAMRVRSGPFGRFYGCQEYPNCRISVNVSAGTDGNVLGHFRSVPIGTVYQDTDGRTRVGTQSGRGRLHSGETTPPTPRISRRDPRAARQANANCENRAEPAAEPVLVVSERDSESEFGKMLRAAIRQRLEVGT